MRSFPSVALDPTGAERCSCTTQYLPTDYPDSLPALGAMMRDREGKKELIGASAAHTTTTNVAPPSSSPLMHSESGFYQCCECSPVWGAWKSGRFVYLHESGGAPPKRIPSLAKMGGSVSRVSELCTT